MIQAAAPAIGLFGSDLRVVGSASDRIAAGTVLGTTPPGPLHGSGTARIAVSIEPNAVITDNYEAGIGRLVFVGDEVTLDNLGVNNKLVWVSDDE